MVSGVRFVTPNLLREPRNDSRTSRIGRIMNRHRRDFLQRMATLALGGTVTTLAWARSDDAHERFDLLINGGTVVDPSQNLRGAREPARHLADLRTGRCFDSGTGRATGRFRRRAQECAPRSTLVEAGANPWRATNALGAAVANAIQLAMKGLTIGIEDLR